MSLPVPRRRGFIAALGAGLVAAPSLVRAAHIMPVRVWTPPRPALRARFIDELGRVLAESLTPVPQMPNLCVSLYGACGPGVSMLFGDTDPVPAPRDAWIARAEITVEGAPGFPMPRMVVGHWGPSHFVAAGEPCRVHGLRLSFSD